MCRRPKTFLDLLPFKGPFPLTGALTGRPPYGKAPYGEASYGKAPSGSLQETLLITGKLTGRLGPYGKPLTRRDGSYGKGGTVLTGRAGRLTGRAGVPYGSFTEKDDEEAYGKAGPLREAPYREERSFREGPYRKGRELPS